jgi:hypothetical protein
MDAIFSAINLLSHLLCYSSDCFRDIEGAMEFSATFIALFFSVVFKCLNTNLNTQKINQ